MFQLSPGLAPEPLYRFQQEYTDGPVTTAAPNSNFLKGVKWSPDGMCFITASDDNWFRIYDTPPAAFAAWPPSSAEDGAIADECAAARPSAADAAADADAAAAAAAAAAGGGGAGAAGGSAVPGPGGGNGGSNSNVTDSFTPALRLEEGELIYDYAWYPAMLASDPVTCCFASTSRAHPVHLWDAATGELRCTYRAYDAADEVTAAYSLAFSPDGTKLWCGFNRVIRAFDVARPGRDSQAIVTYQKKQEGQPGIISCLAPNPDRSGMLAAGAYSGVAALYDSLSRSLVCLLEGYTGGVTQVQFSACGNYLYTGARRDCALHCWDVRYTSGVLYTIQRDTPTTNQRIQFDIEPCGRHLATGGEDGAVRLFDLREGREVGRWQAADDTLNGVSFHPYLPLLATASGHRRLFLAPADDGGSSSSDNEGSSMSAGEAGEAGPAAAAEGHQEAEAGTSGRAGLLPGENVLRIWRYQTVAVEAAPAALDEQQQQEEELQQQQEEELQLEGEGEEPTSMEGQDAVAAAGEPDADEDECGLERPPEEMLMAAAAAEEPDPKD